MSAVPIYVLTYKADKDENTYLKGLQKALFSKAQTIEVDWRISTESFFTSLINAIKGTQLSIAIKCRAHDISDIQIKFDHYADLHIYFSHAYEITDHLLLFKEQKRKCKFIAQVQRSTDLTAIGKIFLEQKLSDLYFSFDPYQESNPQSIPVREVASLISSFNHRFPSLQVKTLPGYELLDPNIDSLLELEPLLSSAKFESNLADSSIRFSFIIPTYNSKHFLSNVIKHIYQQNIPKEEYEIVIVDDGSSDGSDVFIESYLQDEELTGNFRYFYWPKPIAKPYEKPIFRAGLCRNIGANNAKGKYLIFLDSDILVPEGFLKNLDLCFKESDVVQYVRHHIVPEKSTSYVNERRLDLSKDTYIEEENYWGPYFDHEKWSEMPFFWKYTCTYCLAVRKEDFFAVGRFRRAFVSYGFEDTDLGYRLHKKGLRFHLSKLVTLHLTPPIQSMNSGGYQYKRFLALSKTAKIFFLSNLDLEIYHHFHNYMGGERSIFKEISYWLEKFLKRSSKAAKKSENLIR